MRGGLIALLLLGGAAEAAPLSLAASGHATVPLAVEGHGTVEFVFDTGAQGSAVYQPTADAWALPRAAEGATLTGQTGSTSIALALMPRVTLDGVAKEGISAAILPARADGVPLAGIVGLDLFGDRAIDFDWPARRVDLLASDRAETVAGAGAAAVIAEHTAGNLLTFPIRIGGRDGVAVLDTGARKTRINTRFAALLGIGPGTPGFTPGDVVRGATNVPVTTLAGSVAEVELGGARLARLPVLVADLPVFETFGVADRPAAIFGLDWLESLRMVVDFPSRRIWFRPSRGARP
jgi:predicted aspartyl protease